MAGGRPTKYNEKLAEEICSRLMLGQSLNEICRDPAFPVKLSVFKWLHKYPEFMNQYRHARQVQQETHLDEMLEIADDGTNDWMERNNRDGSPGWQLNGEHVQRSRLRVDTRKWVMERLAPKVFGAAASTNPDEDKAQPLNISFEVRDPLGTVKVTNAKSE